MKNELITLVMTSCKAYEDVLEIHEYLMKRHWPDCSFERILVMDEVTPEADYLKGFDQAFRGNIYSKNPNFASAMLNRFNMGKKN